MTTADLPHRHGQDQVPAKLPRARQGGAGASAQVPLVPGTRIHRFVLPSYYSPI